MDHSYYQTSLPHHIHNSTNLIHTYHTLNNTKPHNNTPHQTIQIDPSKKENISLASNYSSLNTSNVPKQILEKTILLKNQHINDLMLQLKKAKSSYEQFKQKIIQENQKLKSENDSLKDKISLFLKQKQAMKKQISKIGQQRQSMIAQFKSLEEESLIKISQAKKQLEDIGNQNKRLSKLMANNKKIQSNLMKQNQETKEKLENNAKILNESRKQAQEKLRELEVLVEKLRLENEELKIEIGKAKQKKVVRKNYDKKLEKLEEKIVKIIQNL